MNSHSDPVPNATAVTPSDTTILPDTIGLYIGGVGNVAVTMLSGEVVTFIAVQTGSILPVRVVKVMSTSTTATNIVAMYK
jgi:hypothetical protein